MKKIVVLLVLICFVSVTYSQPFTITGNMKGLKDSTLVFLQDPSGNSMAQTYSQSGKFKLTATLTEVSFLQIPGQVVKKKSTTVTLLSKSFQIGRAHV